MMSETTAALRIDVDSTRDIALLPQLLDLLLRLDIKATFFITTGPDRLALNLFKYVADPRNSLRFIKSKPLRYGSHSLNGLLRKMPVEAMCPEVLLRAQKEGHEIGLHGYDHYAWIRNLRNMDEIQIKELISRGLAALQVAAEADIRAFASPGFTVTNAMIRAIDALGLDYSSDFKIDTPMAPFYPQAEPKNDSVLQMPVSMDSIGELFMAGYSEVQIKAKMRKNRDVWHEKMVPFVIYAHPAHEVGCYIDLFSSVLRDLLEDSRFIFLTLAQIAQQWKVDV
ncbi:MAG: polysaccharide deacetylase family protein [Halobacteriota archaeon]